MHSSPAFLRVPLAAACVAMLLPACGGRGPLDDSGAYAEELTQGAPSDAGERAPASPRGRDAGVVLPDAAAAALACGQQLLACEAAPSCAKVLNCVLAQCIAEGGASQVSCALGCSGGDYQQLTSLLPLLQCMQGVGSGLGGFAGGRTGG